VRIGRTPNEIAVGKQPISYGASQTPVSILALLDRYFCADRENRSASLDIFVRFASKISKLPDLRSVAPVVRTSRQGFAPPRFDSPTAVHTTKPLHTQGFCVIHVRIGRIGHNSRFAVARLGRDPTSRFRKLAEYRSGFRFSPPHKKQFLCG